MPYVEGEKHPLIELAERHQIKIKALRGEGLLDVSDSNMPDQIFVIPGEEGEDPKFAQPLCWVDGRELTDMVRVRFPDGTIGTVDRRKAVCLVRRLLGEDERALVARYIGQS